MQTPYYAQALQQQMLYLWNVKQIDQQQQIVAELKHRLKIVSLQVSEYSQPISSRQQTMRKNRRKDKDIDKPYQCEECGKIYGSKISLNLHKKLKHRSKPVSQVTIEKQVDKYRLIDESRQSLTGELI